MWRLLATTLAQALLVLVSAPATAVPNITCPDEVSRQLLRQARQAIGTAAALDGVRSVQAEGSRLWASDPDAQPQPLGFTILRPDAFQWNTPPIAHTLRGADFWQNRENPPA